MDAKQNISSIRHFLKKRHWVSEVFAGMCLYSSQNSLLVFQKFEKALCARLQPNPDEITSEKLKANIN